VKTAKTIRCAIYTRVSTDQGLEQEFNSLDAQREASEAYIKSQAHEGWVCLKDHYNDGGYSGGSMERPALQKLLQDVRHRKLDVIVVYKVDRLTRSLADFAKLVELFDAHQVSFVSVTQSFNTTSSMGRLTLNVLLSFAQFEREVTGERIRDKIAASKKKGMWMGGVVPHGYRVEDRKLVVDEAEANEVRLIFELYNQLKSIPALIRELDARGIRTRVRKLASGGSVGGIPFTTGPIAHLLGNRVYLGEINHRDKSYPGEHEPIISAELFNAVQEFRRSNASSKTRGYERSGALLAGLIYDDAGNRMTPVHVKKNGIRYRNYQSWVLAQGQKAKARSVFRVPAGEVEQVVSEAIHKHLEMIPVMSGVESAVQIVRGHVARIVVHGDRLVVSLLTGGESSPDTVLSEGGNQIQTLKIDWSKPSLIRRRAILGNDDPTIPQRPIRSEARTRLLKAIAQGRHWLDQISTGDATDIAVIAERHQISEKTVRSTLSLAFLAPDIVQAAIDGRLPRGLGVSQMTDLPVDWAEQRQQLGLG
jgi:DNA invertase Pin-like site-specific DNA recombinase